MLLLEAGCRVPQVPFLGPGKATKSDRATSPENSLGRNGPQGERKSRRAKLDSIRVPHKPPLADNYPPMAHTVS